MPGESFAHDPHGHGTQVAGVLHAVCSNTRVVDVRVLGADGSGRIDDIVRGLEYVVEHYFEHKATKGRLHSVINLSFSGASSSALKNVLLYISKILLIVGASGDEDLFSCEVSPSNSEFILTVGAASWNSSLPLMGSNYGSCIRIRAAAERIIAPYIGESNTAVRAISGSSVATAFISGVAARVVSVLHAMPGAAEALYSRFPDVSRQREIVEFMTDMIALPVVLHYGETGAHMMYHPPCTLLNITYIERTLEQLLNLNSPPVVSSAGGRRAMERMKSRFKDSRRMKLESKYETPQDHNQ
jgi:hypothetical protein